jgi:tRNA(Ile)-lysidine synthase
VEESLDSLLIKNSRGEHTLDVDALALKPDFLWSEILVELFHRLQIEPTEKKIEALQQLCSAPTGHRVELNGRLSVYRDRNHLVFTSPEQEERTIRPVEYGGCYEYNGGRFSIGTPEAVPSSFGKTHEVEYIDADRLGGHLVLRSWQAGDWFIPLGMKTKKKLSDFFTDQKIPRYQKSSVPVLESDGSIVWICGKRLDERFKLTERTRTAIRLTYQPLT